MNDWCDFYGMWINEIEDNTDVSKDMCPEGGMCEDCNYGQEVERGEE